MKKQTTASLLLLCMLAALPQLAGAQAQRWWGHFTDAMTAGPMGTEMAETYNCAAQFAPTRAILSGATVHGVRFYLRDKTNVSDVKVWLSTTQPATADQANIAVVEVAQASLVDHDNDQQMLEVTLPEAYTFTGQTIYVGYTFRVSSAKTAADKLPVYCAGKGNGASGSFWLRTSGTLRSWNNMAASYGALALQLLISNPAMNACDVQVGAAERLVVMAGDAVATGLSIQSDGFMPVNDVDYVVTAGGLTLPEQHYVLPKPLWGPGSSAQLPVGFTAPAARQLTDYSVSLTKVNGQANASAAATATGTLATVSRLGIRRTVVEEFTGTWCTNCPRGIVGMENMQREYGDRFVGIAVHSGDPMALSAYQPIVPSSVPKCSMDRSLMCDPYQGLQSDGHYHAGEAFGLMCALPTEADLALSAAWADEARTQLRYTAATTFYLDAAGAPYALAFVLTEDGMSGATSEWWQVNGEKGHDDFPDDDMERFRNGDNPMKDISYDHVAVAVEGIVGGMEGSIADAIADNRPQTWSKVYSIAGNTLIQDKSRLTANVLLLDTRTGQVINAAKAPIGDYDPAGIESAARPSEAAQRVFDLQGRRVLPSTLLRGLYIRDGKKIIINQQ